MVSVANEGDATAEETVFLFIRDVVASIARPRMELKGFSKIELSPGERGILGLVLPVSALQFPGRDFNPVLEPGTFEVLVGPCADRQKLVSATVMVSDDPVQGRGP